MKKILLIPIDDRPVCNQLPKQIAELEKGISLHIPDKKLLGNLTKNADIQGLLKWLGNNNAEIVILSLDTIAYGGLIPSRRSTDTFEQIKTRIDELIGILKKKKAKIYAFSSIMRISNNNINEEEKEYWADYGTKIFKYSYELHKTGNAQTDIPENIINDYLLTRKRNFEINKYYIELAKQGIFETLVFSKDDCSEYGLNIKEANELKELSSGCQNVFIKTGADEIPLTLLSRAVNKHKNLKIAPKYINPESINEISKYEDISVADSVKSQIELAGAIVSDEKNADLILLVNNFKDEQGELVMNVKVPLFSGELKLPNKPYFIADITNANGSDNNFVKALFENDNLKEFYGYSAWNTTGNTLGSAIASALTYFGAKHPDPKIFRILQITRFLDDWAYQANVREKIRENTENLTNNKLKEEMKSFEDFLLKKFNLKNVHIEYFFPWNRFFETEIVIHHKYIKIPFVDILFYE